MVDLCLVDYFSVGPVLVVMLMLVVIVLYMLGACLLTCAVGSLLLDRVFVG